eukprot:GDKK01010425.1.p1 GENE.GDKK01010425.1~~GDKK01010425.1.p1  ORF type:complete len:645 (-),score=59.57 GDKK01010425.1:282-2117(-)
MYHFDGRHLYLKIADMWTPYPNAYIRKNISIPSVMSVAVDIVIKASCPSKNAQGYCTTPAEADPPSDIDIKIKVCKDKAQQITPLKPQELCPNISDIMPPSAADPNVLSFKDCAEYTSTFNVWRCVQGYVKNGNYCQASCNMSCRVYNPFPPRCSFMEPCIESEFKAPQPETCGTMNNQPLTDECTMKVCDSVHGNLGYVPLGQGAPCNYNAASAGATSTCNGNLGCVVRSAPSALLPIATRLTDRPSGRATASSIVEISVSKPQLVTAVQVIIQALPSLAYQTFTMAKQTAQSTDVAAIYRYTASAPVRRNVTVVLTTTLPGTNGTLIFRFLDWNAQSNVAPSFGSPSYDSGSGAFSITIDPIDWVSSAELWTGYGSFANVTALTCDYGTTPRCYTATALPLAGDAYVSLKLATGINVKRSLPCLTPSLIGYSCNTTIHTVRTATKCKAGLVITSLSAWYAAIAPSADTAASLIRNVTLRTSNELKLQTWGSWTGGTWAEDVGANLTLTLSTGEKEYFWLPKWSEGKIGDALMCVSGVRVVAPDERGRVGTCSAVGKCDPIIDFSNVNVPPTYTQPAPTRRTTASSASTRQSTACLELLFAIAAALAAFL